MSQHLDTCIVGSWVFATSPLTPGNATITGRIVEILRDVNHESNSVVLLDLFEVVVDRHPIFDMPVLTWPLEGQKIVAIAGKVITLASKPLKYCL